MLHRKNLINEWLTRFALNASISLDEKTRGVYLAMWLEQFADIRLDRLKAAFEKTLATPSYPKIPMVADVRQHLSKAEEAATSIEAHQKWEQVLRYANSTSPDLTPKPIKIKERTQAAIRAAGGLDWMRDCSTEELQWVKKRFIYAYEQWNELEKDLWLLPEGPVKEQLKGLADAKQKQLAEKAS